MRRRITTFTIDTSNNALVLDSDITIDDIRLIIDETQNKVICSSMQKANVTISDKSVVVKDSVCKLAEGDHITFEIDTADGLEYVSNAVSKSEAAIKAETDKILLALEKGLQGKEVEPADIEQIITPDDGYLGLQHVKVAPYKKLYYDEPYSMNSIAYANKRSGYNVCVAGEFDKKKNITSTALLGADAYLTSDGDFYTDQTIHIWHDDDDMHSNRWVVYYFKNGENKSDFIITEALACPTVLAINGHLGTIISNTTVSIRDIIVLGDSSITDIQITNITWQSFVRINITPKEKYRPNESALLRGNNVVCAEIKGLKSCLTEKVTTNHNYAYIAYECPNLQMLILPDLEIANACCIYGCPKLTLLYLPKLKRITYIDSPSSWSFLQSSKIDTLYLPELQSASAVILFESASQNKIIAPKLTYIYVSRLFQFYSVNTTLTTLVFGSVTTSWNFSPDPRGVFGVLIHFEFGADGGVGLSASLNLYCWTCHAIVLTADDLVEDKDKFTTNKEQLLYNFKTYTIERLQNRTNMSKLTLTIGTNLYNIVTQETDDSFTDGVPYGEWLTAKLAEINWSLASA